MKLLRWFLIFACLPAFGQAARYQGNVYTINASAPQPGGLYPVLASTTATVQICTYSTTQTCPSLATTYTNASQATSCPTTAQLTPSNSGACTASVDAEGGFGAWLAPGNYQYMVTTSYGTFGPYDFTVGGGGSSGPLTTKGDIYGYSTTNARIPVGSDGQVLTADSTQTLGVKWAAAGLPTSTSPGQIIASTAAGTTYAVQPQVYYSQPGDTIASIESECSSLCTYIVTQPQTITLAANHTLSANVALYFEQGGVWTVTGGAYTLTLSANVQGTLSQHFIYSGGATVYGLTGNIPVEWFGAFGTPDASGGDAAPGIQLTINAINNGCAQLQSLDYLINETIDISQTNDGLCGQVQGIFPTIYTSNTSMDFIDVTGNWAKVENLGMSRNAIPTGSAKGLSCVNAGGLHVSQLLINDSVYGMYFSQCPSDTQGYIRDSQIGWGRGESSGTYYGVYFDGTVGAENSIELTQISVAGQASTSNSALFYGFYIYGSHVNDIDCMQCITETNTVSAYVNYTGGGGDDTDTDIHFIKPIFDGCIVSCVYVNNLISDGPPIASFQDGFMAMTYSNLPVNEQLIDIEGSEGVSITGNQILEYTRTNTAGRFVYLHNDSDINISSNMFSGAPAANIWLTGTNYSTMVGNTFQNGLNQGAVFNINATSVGNTIVGNTATYEAAMFIDSADSVANDVVGNTCGSGTCTAPTYPFTGTTPSYLATGSTLNGLNILSAGSPTVNQAACIKSAGPPVVIGYCSTIVGSGGACTCN